MLLINSLSRLDDAAYAAAPDDNVAQAYEKKTPAPAPAPKDDSTNTSSVSSNDISKTTKANTTGDESKSWVFKYF